MSNSRKTEFNQLADVWDRETGYYSFWRMMTRHAAYPKLLEFGTEAIPWLLERLLTDKSLRWSSMLSKLTGEEPANVPESVPGGGFVAIDVTALGNAWLDWGVSHGYLTKLMGEYVLVGMTVIDLETDVSKVE